MQFIPAIWKKKKILRAHLGIHLKIIVKTFGGREEGITHLSKIIWFLWLCFIWSLFHNWLWVCIRHLHHAWWYQSFIKDWRGKKSDPPYTVLKRMSHRGLSCALLLYLVRLLPDFWVTSKDNSTCPLPGYFVLSQLTEGMAAYSSSKCSQLHTCMIC